MCLHAIYKSTKPKRPEEVAMTTQFNGTDFATVEAKRFAPAFEGAQAKRDFRPGLMHRRSLRRIRRENRAL